MPAVYKVLGQEAPTGTSATTLYTVPASKEAVGSTLIISNITSITGSAATATATVYVRPAGAAQANKHIIVPGIDVPAKSAEAHTIGMTLATTDVVTVKSSAANALSFTLFGTEI